MASISIQESCHLHVVEAGSNDRDPIIIVHGGRGTADHKADFFAFRPLSNAFHLYAYDQRGHGRSSGGESASFGRLVADLEQLRVRLFGQRPISIIGVSYGGMVALSYAISYPEKVEKLVVIGCAASHDFVEPALQQYEIRRDCAPLTSKTMVRRMLDTGFDSDLELRLAWFALRPLYGQCANADELLSAAASIHFDAALHRSLVLNPAYDMRNRLAAVEANTLVVCGADDWIFTPQFSKEIASGISRCELLIVPDCGHAAHVGAPELVLSAIHQHVAGRVSVPRRRAPAW
ncbi:alpha/beta fold hydrolase [Chelatococcus asaccharovorans]|uniref:Proline iminopeptidase n=1 Tax=Chelatococcus asaccharovorans TaxID=28210 RepID=A0A2V3UKG6_9HYPH|nr:alpha/beta hydrolase [Chelatococcus asaccharovorans]MBS7705587.1 alpha/beta hydrolase [Chelatococcus asaccharovorans]PXW60002.1 proline iminopeptidase [Chelatococcus asaccharovorans]